MQVRGNRGGDRKGSQVQSKKPKKGSEKGKAVSANVARERSTKQEVKSNNAEARLNERQKVMLGTLGYGPRAQSVLHCHGVLALRGSPLTGAVPHESQLSDNAGKLVVGNAGTQGKARFELQDDGLSCKMTQAKWQLAVQEGREKQGLKLVSRQFRKQR